MNKRSLGFAALFGLAIATPAEAARFCLESWAVPKVGPWAHFGSCGNAGCRDMHRISLPMREGRYVCGFAGDINIHNGRRYSFPVSDNERLLGRVEGNTVYFDRRGR